MGRLGEVMYIQFLAGPKLGNDSSINVAIVGGGGALVLILSFYISGHYRMRSK